MGFRCSLYCVPKEIVHKYENFTEKLLERIKAEDSITKRHYMIPIYLHERNAQIQKVLANIENDDIDFAMVIEQLWEDLQLACEQIKATMVRSDFYADKFNLTK